MATLADVMSRDILTVARSATLGEVARQLRSQNVGSALVVDEANAPIGIITERELVDSVAASRNPDAGVAESWMKPLVRGRETKLVEIPASWYLDDLPPMMFIKTSSNSHGFVNPRDVEQIWRDQFDWVYREFDYAVFTMTIHPDVSGRPQVLLMLERVFDYISKHAGVKFCTFDEIADDFRRRYPRQGAAAQTAHAG